MRLVAALLILTAACSTSFAAEPAKPATDMQMPDPGTGATRDPAPTESGLLAEELVETTEYNDGTVVAEYPDGTVRTTELPHGEEGPVVIHTEVPGDAGTTIEITDVYPAGTRIDGDGKIIDENGNPATVSPDRDRDGTPDPLDSDPDNPLYGGKNDASDLPLPEPPAPANPEDFIV